MLRDTLALTMNGKFAKPYSVYFGFKKQTRKVSRYVFHDDVIKIQNFQKSSIYCLCDIINPV